MRGDILKRVRERGKIRKELPGIWFVRKLTFSHFYLFINQILLILSSTQTINIFSHFCPPTFIVVKNKEKFPEQNSKNEELSPSFLPLRSTTPVHSFRNSYFPYWKKQVKNIIKKCRLSIHWLWSETEPGLLIAFSPLAGSGPHLSLITCFM